MEPEEIIAAAHYLNQTTGDFINEYSSTQIFDENDDENNGDHDNKRIPWITIKNKLSDEDGSPSCYFLDTTTNMCTIYPVRPIQCSTYPFWSNIISTKSNWNDEVRRKENDNFENDNNYNKNAAADAAESNPSSFLPPWTPEGGGCEGMEKIPVNDCDGTATPSFSSSIYGSESTTSDAVTVEEAMRQLIQYERNNRRVPRPNE